MRIGAFEAGAGRLAVDAQGSGGRQEIIVRALGADASLDRMAMDAQLVLLPRQRLAERHAQLPFHQVQPRDRFRHRMLDLQPRVHLHEEKVHFSAGALLDDELHRPGADIVHGLRRRHRGAAHLPAHGLGHARRRRLFQHLLVATLHRAVALEQVDVVAVRVAEHLDLDVTRALHQFLDQHGVVAEAADGLALAGRQRGLEVGRLFHRAHALAAAAGARLDQHRIADAVGFRGQQHRILVRAVIARHQRHAGLFHQLLGFGLQAHGLDRRGRRADEDQPGLSAGPRERLVLAEEAIAGVDGLRTGGLGRLDDALPAQVAVFGRAAADVHRLVAGAHVHGVRVGVRVHGDGLDGHAACGGGHPAGDLATVRNQYLLEHVSSFL